MKKTFIVSLLIIASITANAQSIGKLLVKDEIRLGDSSVTGWYQGILVNTDYIDNLVGAEGYVPYSNATGDGFNHTSLFRYGPSEVVVSYGNPNRGQLTIDPLADFQTTLETYYFNPFPINGSALELGLDSVRLRAYSGSGTNKIVLQSTRGDLVGDFYLNGEPLSTSAINYGTEGQIAYTTPTGDGFLYTNNLRWYESGGYAKIGDVYIGNKGQSPAIYVYTLSSGASGASDILGFSGGAKFLNSHGGSAENPYNFQTTLFGSTDITTDNFVIERTGTNITQDINNSLLAILDNVTTDGGSVDGYAFEYNNLNTTKFFIDIDGVANYGGVPDSALTDSSLTPKRYVDKEMAQYELDGPETAALADTWYSLLCGTVTGNQSDGFSLIDDAGYVKIVVDFDGYLQFSGKATFEYLGTASAAQSLELRPTVNGISNDKFYTSVDRSFDANTFYEVVSWVGEAPVSAGDTLDVEWRVSTTNLQLNGRNGDPAFALFLQELKVKEQSSVNFTPVQ